MPMFSHSFDATLGRRRAAQRKPAAADHDAAARKGAARGRRAAVAGVEAEPGGQRVGRRHAGSAGRRGTLNLMEVTKE